MSTTDRLREALLAHFGFPDFREGQAEVIRSVLEGRDSVVVMPTGGGKSLCYQLPATLLEGVTLVVSPLIALMKDQVDSLTDLGIPTTFINSSVAYSELNARLAAVRRGAFKLVYVAPERFRNEAFTRAIAGVKFALLAVDEAHCISHWGHDFRPDYLRLREAAQLIGRPRIIALTGTATPKVREDIIKHLGLESPRLFVAGFDRPNLRLAVEHVSTESKKQATLKRVVSGAAGAGIAYCATRKAVEQISASLKLAGINVEPYHAGLDDSARSRAQDHFMSGKLQAIIATNAFGMGIDKPDIRFVVHYQLPGSIEAYYQEVGRAGRDGLPSDCLLLFNYADTRTQQFFIDGAHPPLELIQSIWELISSLGLDRVELNAREIASRLDVKNEMSVNSALLILEKAGHIARGRPGEPVVMVGLESPVDVALDSVAGDSPEGRVLRDLIFTFEVTERETTEVNLQGLGSDTDFNVPQARRLLHQLAARGLLKVRASFEGRGIKVLDKTAAAALRIDKRELAARAAAEQWKLRRMIDYCYHEACLRQFILRYFGDRKLISTCSACSNCAPVDYLVASSGAANRSSRGGTLSLRPAKSRARTERNHFEVTVEAEPPARKSKTGTRELLTPATDGGDVNARATGMPNYSVPSARSLTGDEVVIVKKILSCVARMNDRFGKGTVIAVLRGSKSKQVTDHQLDRLSTYGLLADMREDSVGSFFKALIEAGCVEVREKAYPTVRLSDFGRLVMTGRTEVELALPEQTN
ncbi:MAG TPA: ATP-dependent DNA helicase RecQ [Blastocatellia bacterium]|nr:ATP-dependent DNA helicase RecQ [Blastocatellia bacterium]